MRGVGESRLRASLSPTRLPRQPPLSACTRCTVVGRRERVLQVEDLLAVDEEAHVRAHAVLLVDHAEAQAGVVAVEVGEQLGERRAARLDLAALACRSAAGWGSAPSSARHPQLGRLHRVDLAAGAARCRSSARLRRGSPTARRWSCRSRGRPDRCASAVIAWRFTVHQAWLSGRPASSRCQRLAAVARDVDARACRRGSCAARRRCRPSGTPRRCRRRAGAPPSGSRCRRPASACSCRCASTSFDGRSSR